MLNDITIRDLLSLLSGLSLLLASDRTVTVRVTPDQLADAKAMARITAATLGRLGCPGCHSGFDIRFLLERDFRATPELDVVSLGALPAALGALPAKR